MNKKFSIVFIHYFAVASYSMQNCEDASLQPSPVKKIHLRRPSSLSVVNCVKPLISPKRDIDKITYIQHKEDKGVISATCLTVKDFADPAFFPPSPSKQLPSMKELKDISTDDIKLLLVRLDLLPSAKALSADYQVEKLEKTTGHYTAAIYRVSKAIKLEHESKQRFKLMYAVKFHNPLRTSIHALWNQNGIKNHKTLKNCNLKIKNFPKLAFEEVTAKIQLADNNYLFSVLHAASGLSAYEVYEHFGKLDPIERESHKPAILSSLTQIGLSLGTFHSYHAIKDPALRDDCIRYILKVGAPEGFLTITHNDLHPGNIILDMHGVKCKKLTLIDLESMFVSTVSPFPNASDVIFFTSNLTKMLAHTNLAAEFVSHFRLAYDQGLKDTLKYFIVSKILKTSIPKALQPRSEPQSTTLGPTILFQNSLEIPSD